MQETRPEILKSAATKFYWFGLGANIRIRLACHCDKKDERDRLHGLTCTKNAGLFSRQTTLNIPIKQTLGSLNLPSILDPRGLFRIDDKRFDGVMMIPWEMSIQMVGVTDVDALAPSRLSQGSLCNPRSIRHRG